MPTHQSPHNTSDTGSCSTLGGCHPNEPGSRKRKYSISTSDAHQTPPAREYGVMRDAGERDDASRFVGSASGIHYIRAVHLRLARRSAARMGKAANNTLIPGEDDQLQKGASVKKTGDQFLWKANEVVLSGNEEGVPPSFEDYVEWSKSYFESWHPVLPFVHGPEILRLFEDACTNGFSSLAHENQVILKSILSISLADSRQGISTSKPIPHHVIFSTVDDALSSSNFALSRPASIRSTQAAFAIQLFLTSMLCLNAASRLGGLIVRGAFHLGLHRCPTRFSFFNPEQASVRRRVFWCIYTLERLLCQSLGLPLDIQDNDIDVCYIGEERHMHLGSDAEETGRLRLLTFVAKHARLRGLILELRNKSILQRQDTADRTVYVRTELAKWANEIQEIVEEDDVPPLNATESGVPPISTHHRIMLLLLKHESAICLNRPSLASEFPSPCYSSSFQECISAAKCIFILLRKHGHRHQLISDSTFPKLVVPLLWPSFTWAVWISAFVLIHAGIEGQVPLETAVR